MSTEFHIRLKATREKRQLSQEELGKKAKLNTTAVSHFETKSRKPSFDNLKNLADALDVSVDFLMGRTDNLHGKTAEEASIFRHVENLTDEDLQLAESFMASLAKRREPKE